MRDDLYEEPGGHKPSTELMFQEIVRQAQRDVRSGAEASARRSSRRRAPKLVPEQLASNGISSISKRPSPPPVEEPSIKLGSRHQAEVVELEDFHVPSDDQREAEDERAECFWRPDAESKVTMKDMDEFVATCRRHMDVGTDMAMCSVFKHGYDLPSALEDMELDFKDHWKTRFLRVEDDKLVTALHTYGKNFAKIAKYVKSRKVHECIGRYYDVKKKICYMTKQICPTLMRRNTDDYRIVLRSHCENCSTNLFERQLKCEVRGRKRTFLCPPCDFYAKLKKLYRPIALRYTPREDGLTEEEHVQLYYEHTAYFDINDYLMGRMGPDQLPPRGHILAGFYYVSDPSDLAQTREKRIPVFTEPHENCFFVSTAEKIRWERAIVELGTFEKEKVVDGFLRFGKNFPKITKFANLLNEETVRQFYELYGEEYRLDFLIAQYNRTAQLRRHVLGEHNESDDDSENFAVRSQLIKRAHFRKRHTRGRAVPGPRGGGLRRTTRRRTVREMS
ncbi:hypothetical protein QR680_005037 [Steinernema hermaphroditum]|uniref:SANT domain-containing protein n=1 Tax=Steinernema hermaphroditum TaxID=289476 RepID=A0AA39HSU9_9BILA|nr:hypothetical protein QR680_005037 [Steinernema hermaphroditum]